MTDVDNVMKVILACWGIIFTINSAVSAFLQTKWMFDQRRYLKSMHYHLLTISGLLEQTLQPERKLAKSRKRK